MDRLILAINRRSAELFGFGAEKVGSSSRAQDQIRRPSAIINRGFWIDPNRDDEPETNTIQDTLERLPRLARPSLILAPIGLHPWSSFRLPEAPFG